MAKKPTTATPAEINDAELVDGLDPKLGGALAPSPEIAAAWASMVELGEKAAAKAFPLLKAAIEAHGREFNSVRVTARTEGFRRGGVAHSREAVEHAAGTVTPEQLEAWLGEKNLTVVLV